MLAGFVHPTGLWRISFVVSCVQRERRAAAKAEEEAEKVNISLAYFPSICFTVFDVCLCQARKKAEQEPMSDERKKAEVEKNKGNDSYNKKKFDEVRLRCCLVHSASCRQINSNGDLSSFQALGFYRKAIEMDPTCAAYHNNGKQCTMLQCCAPATVSHLTCFSTHLMASLCSGRRVL